MLVFLPPRSSCCGADTGKARSVRLSHMTNFPGRPLARFHSLDRERRRLVLRAACWVTIASSAVALLPFRWAIRFGSAKIGRGRGIAANDCVWAVEAVSQYLPWRTKCIEKGLAVQRLLRGAGENAILHYGVRRESVGGAIEAHVWVTRGADAVIGGEGVGKFAEVASFPSTSD